MNSSKISSESTASGFRASGYYESRTWHTFGCIPSRFAMLALTCLLSLTSLTSLVIGSLLFSKLHLNVTQTQQAAMIVHIMVSAVLLTFCGFGLYAVIFKSRYHASLFCAMLIGQILIGIASGAVCLYILFTNPPKEDSVGQIMTCTQAISNPPNDLFIKGLCHRLPLAQGICLSLFLVIWILQILTFYAGNQYIGQLREEERVRVLLKGKDLEASDDEIWEAVI